MTAAFFEFSPERFTDPGVIVGIVLMVVGLAVVLASGPISDFFSARSSRDGGRPASGGDGAEDDSRKEEENEEAEARNVGGENRKNRFLRASSEPMAVKIVGATVLVVGALIALLCA